jgi:alanine racemase
MRPTRAEISLSSIKFNLLQVRKRVSEKVRIMGVVKANAYGHGIFEVAKYISEGKIVDYLGVAILEEGKLLRENSIDLPIHCFIQPFEDQLEEVIKYNIEPSIASIHIAQHLNTHASKFNQVVPIHVKVDTGMSRLGVPASSALEFIKEISNLKNLKIQGIFSHLATSDEKDKNFAYEQIRKFRYLKFSLNELNIGTPIFHIANSGAIIDLDKSYFDMVRPGIMMYGYYPSHDTSESIEIKPALSFKSKVGFLKTVEAGTSISYNRRYYTTNRTTIATIPVGYADGLFRTLTNKGNLIINAEKYKIAGTICMDQIMVDVGDGRSIQLGDDVTIIGKNGFKEINAWDIADLIDSIPYEVCCSVSARVPRVYID